MTEEEKKDATPAEPANPAPTVETLASQANPDPADAPAPDAPADAPAPDAEKKEPKDIKAEQYELINQIVGKETFIDPLNPDEITKAYSVYERNPQKLIDVVIVGFQSYCRKCLRETAIINVKNEISNATFDDAEKLKMETIDAMYQRVKKDQILEFMLVMLIFKNTYWNWIRFGLKDIFNEQRSQAGHELNSLLNVRFHRTKNTKNFKTVGDLVLADVTEIINRFKTEIMQKKVRIF